MYTAVTERTADPEWVNPGNVVNEIGQTPKSTHCVSAFAEIPRTGRAQRWLSSEVKAAEGMVTAAEGLGRGGGFWPPSTVVSLGTEHKPHTWWMCALPLRSPQPWAFILEWRKCSEIGCDTSCVVNTPEPFEFSTTRLDGWHGTWIIPQ